MGGASKYVERRAGGPETPDCCSSRHLPWTVGAPRRTAESRSGPSKAEGPLGGACGLLRTPTSAAFGSIEVHDEGRLRGGESEVEITAGLQAISSSLSRFGSRGFLCASTRTDRIVFDSGESNLYAQNVRFQHLAHTHVVENSPQFEVSNEGEDVET